MEGSEFFEKVMTKRGTNPNALAMAIGKPKAQSTFHRFARGLSKQPRRDSLQDAATFLGVNVLAFFDSKIADEEWARINEQRIEPPQDDLEIEFAGTVQFPKQIPVVGTARMGDNGFYEEISGIPGAGDGHIEISTKDPNAYGLRVRGQSMYPAIRDGWYVLIEPNGQPREGEYVLLKLLDGRKMVKEFLFRRPGIVEVASVNGAERHVFDVTELESMQAVGAVVSPSKWRPD